MINTCKDCETSFFVSKARANKNTCNECLRRQGQRGQKKKYSGIMVEYRCPRCRSPIITLMTDIKTGRFNPLCTECETLNKNF